MTLGHSKKKEKETQVVSIFGLLQRFPLNISKAREEAYFTLKCFH